MLKTYDITEQNCEDLEKAAKLIKDESGFFCSRKNLVNWCIANSLHRHPLVKKYSK